MAPVCIWGGRCSGHFFGTQALGGLGGCVSLVSQLIWLCCWCGLCVWRVGCWSTGVIQGHSKAFRLNEEDEFSRGLIWPFTRLGRFRLIDCCVCRVFLGSACKAQVVISPCATRYPASLGLVGARPCAPRSRMADNHLRPVGLQIL